MRNSTATSALPPAARRQALTSASGNPIAVRLATDSADTSLEGGAGADGVEDVGAAPAGVSATAEVAAAAAGGSDELVAAGVATAAAAAAGVDSAAAGAGVLGAGAGAGVSTAAGFFSTFFFAF